MEHVLVTLTGTDSPGSVAALFDSIASSEVELIDIKNHVLAGTMTLHILLGLPHRDQGRGEASPVLQTLLFKARDLGLESNFRLLPQRPIEALSGDRCRYAITAIGDKLDCRGVARITDILGKHGANIEVIRRLSRTRFSSMEFVVRLPTRGNEATQGNKATRKSEGNAVPAECNPEAYCDPAKLRAELVDKTNDLGVDIAIQRENLMRRSKRLVVFDMDSTLIQTEVIDEVAKLAGVEDKVKAITEDAMQGELPFDQSLRRRVAMLRGVPFSNLETLPDSLPLTEGAEDLLKVLKVLGYKTAVLSGGFTFATDVLREKLGLDYAYANRLKISEGKLTGEVDEPILGPERKAELLQAIAEKENIPLAQTIAIGDGANDLAMIQRAGLGIAFHAKPKLKAAADTSLSAGGLDRILYLLGFTSGEIEEILQ